jgi:hypothetical protein
VEQAAAGAHTALHRSKSRLHLSSSSRGNGRTLFVRYGTGRVPGGREGGSERGSEDGFAFSHRGECSVLCVLAVAFSYIDKP